MPLALRFQGCVVAFLQLPELDEEPTAAGEQVLSLSHFVLKGGCRRRKHPAQSGTHLLVDPEANLYVLPLYLRGSLRLGSGLLIPTAVGPLGAGLFARRTPVLEPDLAGRNGKQSTAPRSTNEVFQWRPSPRIHCRCRCQQRLEGCARCRRPLHRIRISRSCIGSLVSVPPFRWPRCLLQVCMERLRVIRSEGSRKRSPRCVQSAHLGR